MKKQMLAMSAFAVTLAVAPACATKGFVRTEVGQVNEKVATLGTSLEETQERVRQNEAKISEVDQRAQQGVQKAEQSAQSAAQAAQAVDKKADAVNMRAEAIEKEARKLVFEVVLSDDNGKFKFGQAALAPETEAAIDQAAQQFKTTNDKAIFIEIEGHTDNVGDKKYNEQLGLTRAEAVKRYLYEKHQVPLHKMNVISYGEDKPVAPNNTRDGRAQNRRVVIKVLA
jgi:peptidoglycan-associated lipoprotein